MRVEKRIERMEKQMGAGDNGCEEWLITYPGGQIVHRNGEGPVTRRNEISVVSKNGAELTLEVLQGKGTE